MMKILMRLFLMGGILFIFQCIEVKNASAQLTENQLLPIIKPILQSVLDTENEVRQTGDVDTALNKRTLDDAEKAVIKDDLKDIKRSKEFLSLRKIKGSLINFKTDLLKVNSFSIKNNKVLVEINVKDTADIDDPDLKSQNLKYGQVKKLQFEFDLKNLKPKLTSKKWVDPPQSFKYDSFTPLTTESAPLNTDEYLNNISQSTANTSSSLVYTSPLSILLEISRIKIQYPTKELLPTLLAQATTLNRSAMKNYITQWVYDRNPSYRNYGNDCTNFASQVLEAGGWKRVGNPSSGATNNNYWWTTPPSNLIPPKQSNSWTVAPDLYQFINASSRAVPTSSASLLNTGDFIFMDFGDGNGIGSISPLR